MNGIPPWNDRLQVAPWMWRHGLGREWRGVEVQRRSDGKVLQRWEAVPGERRSAQARRLQTQAEAWAEAWARGGASRARAQKEAKEEGR